MRSMLSRRALWIPSAVCLLFGLYTLLAVALVCLQVRAGVLMFIVGTDLFFTVYPVLCLYLAACCIRQLYRFAGSDDPKRWLFPLLCLLGNAALFGAQYAIYSTSFLR